MVQRFCEDETHLVISHTFGLLAVASEIFKGDSYFFPRQFLGPKENGCNALLMSEA
jgi:hypothetical protein